MRLRRDAGLTLIELLVALSIFIIVALASAALYQTILKSYIKDRIVQDLQRESDLVLAHFSQNLKEATTYNTSLSNTSTNPNTLAVNLITNGTRKYYVSGGALRYTDENNNDTALTAPGTTVTSFTVSPTYNTSNANALSSVRVQGTLSRTKSNQTASLNFTTTITTRPQ